MTDSIQTVDAGSSGSATRAARAVDVDYLVRPTAKHPVRANRAAAAALRRLSELRRVSKRLDTAYAGAVVLQLLVESPWLASCTLDLRAESAYDDEGGCYRSISVIAEDIMTVSGATFPTEVFGQGSFNEEVAAVWIEGRLESDDVALYCAFRSSDSHEDLALHVCRTEVADLLNQLQANSAASGRAAFQALWPDEGHAMRASL